MSLILKLAAFHVFQNHVLKVNMNILRKAFGTACVLHTHLSQAVSPKLSCYRVVGTSVWTRGFGADSTTSIKDIRERKTVQIIWDKDMVSDLKFRILVYLRS